jgi:double-stranded uracil-DNA glycosylase
MWGLLEEHRSVSTGCRSFYGAPVGFTRLELEAFRDQPVDDLVGPGVRLLFVGINPGLWTAATNTHFARPGNRFYPALYLSGISDRLLDPAAGLDETARQHLLDRGVGVTNLVNRATVRADELSAAELRKGAASLVESVEQWQPKVAAVLGVTAYRIGFNRPRAVAGRQPESLGGADLFVLGNPSGLNAHETAASLARSFRTAAEAAGVALDAPRW